jgi:hypothetical protein
MENPETNSYNGSNKLFRIEQNQVIYFNNGTVSLGFVKYELISSNEKGKYYSFNLVLSQLKNGKWKMLDEYLRVHYWTYMQHDGSTHINDYHDNGKTYALIKIIGIEDTMNGVVPFFTLCDDDNKSFT